MANPISSPLAAAAADAFNGVVDGLANQQLMQQLAQAVMPELKGLAGISYSGDNQQVAARNVGDMSRSGEVRIS